MSIDTLVSHIEARDAEQLVIALAQIPHLPPANVRWLLMECVKVDFSEGIAILTAAPYNGVLDHTMARGVGCSPNPNYFELCQIEKETAYVRICRQHAINSDNLAVYIKCKPAAEDWEKDLDHANEVFAEKIKEYIVNNWTC